MITFQWIIPPDPAWAALAQGQIDAIERDLVALVDGYTSEVTAWLRAEARWKDDTGEARAGLYADMQHLVDESVTLVMSHGPAIPYAWYLETVSRGRFAILPDALDYFAPRLLREVQAIVRRHSS